MQMCLPDPGGGSSWHDTLHVTSGHPTHDVVTTGVGSSLSPAPGLTRPQSDTRRQVTLVTLTPTRGEQWSPLIGQLGTNTGLWLVAQTSSSRGLWPSVAEGEKIKTMLSVETIRISSHHLPSPTVALAWTTLGPQLDQLSETESQFLLELKSRLCWGWTINNDGDIIVTLCNTLSWQWPGLENISDHSAVTRHDEYQFAELGSDWWLTK